MADDTTLLAAETASADRAASDTSDQDLEGVDDALEADELAARPPERFDDWDLQPEILEGLRDMGFLAPMPVQTAVYEHLRAGKDLMVESKTGSGKTAAFGIPIIQDIDEGSHGVQALILAPTRELALQVASELERIAKHKSISVVPIYGGAPIGPQIKALQDGAQIIAGTPGRVLDHIRRGTFKTGGVRMLVLDECDEMLSMGFLEEIENIIRALPAKEQRQTLLFSATLPDDIQRIGTRHMREPDKISLSNDGIGVDLISHYYYVVSGMARTRDLLKVIRVERPESAIIFCNTREDTNVVAKFLCRNGYDAEAISSDLSQKDRERVMQRMRDRNLRFLVATDIAARGIDISDLSHVINYTFPESPEVYVHRTGRTGRAGKDGVALSLVGPRELGAFYYLKLIYKIRPEERELPSAADLAALVEAETLDRVLAGAEGEPSEAVRGMAQRILEGEDAEVAVATLVRRVLDAEERVQKAEERARKAETELERARRARPAADERDDDEREARGDRDDDRGRRRRRRRDRDELRDGRRGRRDERGGRDDERQARRGRDDEREARGDRDEEREARRGRDDERETRGRDDEGDERRARRDEERKARRSRRDEPRDDDRDARSDDEPGRRPSEARRSRDDGEERGADDESNGRRRRRRRRRGEEPGEREVAGRNDERLTGDDEALEATDAEAEAASDEDAVATGAAEVDTAADDARSSRRDEDDADERPSRRRRRRRRGEEPGERVDAAEASDDADEPDDEVAAAGEARDDERPSRRRRRRRRDEEPGERADAAEASDDADEPDDDGDEAAAASEQQDDDEANGRRRRRRRRRGEEPRERVDAAEAIDAGDASDDDEADETAAASEQQDDDEANGRRRRRRRRRGEKTASAGSDKPATEPDGDREFWEAWADEKTDGGDSDSDSDSDSRPEKRARSERNGRGERKRRSRDGGDERKREGRKTRDDGDEGGDSDDERGGTARLYVNIGKREEATADEIRALLAEDLGDEGDQIGSVALRNTHCYVRVPDELVDRLIESLEGKTFRDREVVVERARR